MAPLEGFRFVQAGNGPTTRRAGTLLALLGAEVVAALDPAATRAVLADPRRTHHAGRRVLTIEPHEPHAGALARVPAAGILDGVGIGRLPSGTPVVVVADDVPPAVAWANSGVLALSGATHGPPLHPPGDQAAGLAAAAAVIELLSALGGTRVRLDGPALAGERAALAGLTRQGRTAPGGSARLLRAADGWVVVNLPRATDLDLAGAWIGDTLGPEPWPRIIAFLADQPARSAVEAAQDLGLAVGLSPSPGDAADDPQARARGQRFPMTPVVVDGAPPALPPATALDPKATFDPTTTRPRPLAGRRVIDLSALWAGPLATSIVAAAGADVVKVESTGRPDGARYGPRTFFDLLNGGKRSVALDFTDPEGRATLRVLVDHADLVVEASRPRALEQLAIEPEHWLRHHGHGSWVAITAYGRTGPRRQWSGFGDDAAVAGGMIVAGAEAPSGPMFCADAYADPATGLYAAAVALAALVGSGGMFDVALREVVNHLLAEPGDVPAGRVSAAVAAPRARTPNVTGPGLGQDNALLAGSGRPVT